MEYYEKRETNDGFIYVPAVSLVPGIIYYVRCLDPNNQVYFSPVQDPLTPPPSGGISVQSVPIVENSSFTQCEINNANALHLGVCVTSCFIPGLPFLVGFPFCYVKFRDLANRSDKEIVISTERAYEGVGWTAWVLHLLCTMVLCMIWGATYGCYYEGSDCTVDLLWLIIIGSLTFLLTVVVTIIGSTVISMLPVKN